MTSAVATTTSSSAINTAAGATASLAVTTRNSPAVGSRPWLPLLQSQPLQPCYHLPCVDLSGHNYDLVYYGAKTAVALVTTSDIRTVRIVCCGQDFGRCSYDVSRCCHDLVCCRKDSRHHSHNSSRYNYHVICHDQDRYCHDQDISTQPSKLWPHLPRPRLSQYRLLLRRP